MSFILDALKKSERERESSVSAKLSAAPSEVRSDGQRWNWSAIVAIFLLASLLAVLMIVVSNPSQELSRIETVSQQPEIPLPATSAQTDVRSLAQEVSVASRQPNASDPASLTAPSATTTASSSAVTTMYSELSADLRQELGPLHVDAHAFSEINSERFVLINLKRYVEGSSLSGGAIVRQITPEGVILEFRRTEFFLPRN